MPNNHIKQVISLQRKEYTDNLEAWKRNERRFDAGEDVYDDLRAFQWEAAVTTEDSESGSRTAAPALGSYHARKDAAICIEFAAMLKEKFGGLLFQHFPQEGAGLDLGRLRSEDGGWRADLLIKDADGTGTNARGLDSFWRDEMEHAMAPRYRWIMAESPAGGAANREEEEEKRPYFVGFSPNAVPYWFEERGDLQCIRIVLSESRPRKKDGKITHEPEEIHYIMTRRGFTGWGTSEDAGPEFRLEDGGWWMVDKEGEIIERDGIPAFGDWEETGGEIPVAPLYYERGRPGNKDTGITHIGRIQAEMMNQLSAMFYSSWVGGSGVVFFAGADDEQWKTIREAGLLGGQWVPIPPKTSETGTPANVEVVALAAFDASPAIVRSLEWLLKLATQLILRELTTSPDASGAARQLEFLHGNTPRLSNMAANAEECMTTMHRFLEMRWGYPEPESSVKWTRQFDLRTTLEKIKSVLEMMAVASAQSPTLIGKLIADSIKSEGLVPDNEEGEALIATIQSEVTRAAEVRERETDVLESILG